MKSSDLHSLWTAPDNSRITTKQFSFRLPVHVAAKIQALAEMYPQKSKTEIVGDLLATALEDVSQGMPYVKGDYLFTTPDGEDIYDDLGPGSLFWKLADKHYRALEIEMGNPNPLSLSEAMRKPKYFEDEK